MSQKTTFVREATKDGLSKDTATEIWNRTEHEVKGNFQWWINMGVIKNPDGWKTVEEVNPFGWLENTNHENYREIIDGITTRTLTMGEAFSKAIK